MPKKRKSEAADPEHDPFISMLTAAFSRAKCSEVTRSTVTAMPTTLGCSVRHSRLLRSSSAAALSLFVCGEHPARSILTINLTAAARNCNARLFLSFSALPVSALSFSLPLSLFLSSSYSLPVSLSLCLCTKLSQRSCYQELDPGPAEDSRAHSRTASSSVEAASASYQIALTRSAATRDQNSSALRSALPLALASLSR